MSLQNEKSKSNVGKQKLNVILISQVEQQIKTVKAREKAPVRGASDNDSVTEKIATEQNSHFW